MNGASIGGVASATVGRGRLVAALLIVALLLCHGALGALYQASLQAVEHGGGHHAHAMERPAPADHGMGHHAGLVAHADYAAVLFGVLLGATLVLIPGRFPALSFAAAPCAPRPAYIQPVLIPPRGPILPLLQVFRL